ncbi:MAG TPA: hypothetical protein PKD18_16845 [Saprospiraceae bacterium]|nr:hypothetical protein [Saprospiraceae bacterium]HPN71791.1 hypothetical protein [Saprospiraceae bacterium]
MDLSNITDKNIIFQKIESFIEEKGFNIAAKDHQRPWGGFLVLDESQAPLFVETFFPHLSMSDFAGFEKLSPKILILAPNKRLSWQYHHRRSEIWKLIMGVAGVVISDDDNETSLRHLELGDIVTLKCGERHRLVGTDGFGVIAEIWQHEDKNHPSDEDDIVRVQDDFGR